MTRYETFAVPQQSRQERERERSRIVGLVPLWRIIYTDAYLESYDDLDDSEDTVQAAEALARRVTRHPKKKDPIPGLLQIRVNKTSSYEGYTPVRLYYWIEGRTIYLARIEVYDENEED